MHRYTLQALELKLTQNPPAVHWYTLHTLELKLAQNPPSVHWYALKTLELKLTQNAHLVHRYSLHALELNLTQNALSVHRYAFQALKLNSFTSSQTICMLSRSGLVVIYASKQTEVGSNQLRAVPFLQKLWFMEKHSFCPLTMNEALEWLAPLCPSECRIIWVVTV